MLDFQVLRAAAPGTCAVAALHALRASAKRMDANACTRAPRG